MNVSKNQLLWARCHFAGLASVLDCAGVAEVPLIQHAMCPRLPGLIVLIYSAVAAKALETLGNVTLVERPVRVPTLVSAVRTAIRSRQRQYLIREYLAERELTEKALREKEERLRLIMEKVHDHTIYTLDVNGNISS